MSDRADRSRPTFEPPPHANAEVHARIMAELEKMTSAEFFQTLVDAGIYTPDGQLTEHHRTVAAARSSRRSQATPPSPRRPTPPPPAPPAVGLRSRPRTTAPSSKARGNREIFAGVHAVAR
jgi:hypothetical protein